jgi:multiple sugar transport system permease protein
MKGRLSRLLGRGRGTVTVSDSIFGMVLLLPLVIWTLAVVGYPFLATIWMSFRNQTVPASPSEFVGLVNYVNLLADEPVRTALGNSVVWTLGNAVVQVVLGYTAALLLNYPLRRSRFAQTVVVIPWIIPTIAMALTWRWMLDATSGVVGYALRGLGIVEQAPNLLGSLGTAMPTLIFLNSWRWFPFLAVVILAALQNIPQEEYDAAAMDGASFLRQFFDISFPHLTPTLMVVGLLGTLLAFNTFDIIYMITRGGPVTATTTLPVLVYKTAFESYRMSKASTYAVVTILVMVLFAGLFLYGGRIVGWMGRMRLGSRHEGTER